MKQYFTSSLEKQKEEYNILCIKRIQVYFTTIFLENIIKLNNESGKIPLYNIRILDAANNQILTRYAGIFEENLVNIGQIIQMSDPNLEKFLLTDYVHKDENNIESQYTLDQKISIITQILRSCLNNEIKHMKLFNDLTVDIQKTRLHQVITNCNTYLITKNGGRALRRVVITGQIGITPIRSLKTHLINDELNLTPNGELNFGIFNYYFAKEFLNFAELPKFTMEQWIILMNNNNNYNKLFFDQDKRIDLINRVRLIFKEMFMRQQTEIILLDGHGRTIFLLIQFMHVYNYKFNIKVYEISDPTHLWHEDFFPTLPDPVNNNVLVNINESIEQLISTPELCEANLPNRLVYLNFCGIQDLYQLILNFIKKYENYNPRNFSLWISSIVTRTDVGYLYNISENPGSISNFFKIGILLYISFISSGNTIGESDKIPVKLIKDNLYDTALSLDFRKVNQRDIEVLKEQLKIALLEHMDNDIDASGNSIVDKLFRKIIQRENLHVEPRRRNIARQPLQKTPGERHDETPRERFDIDLDAKIKSILNEKFYHNLTRIIPEQKCVIRRGGEKYNQPNKGQSFVTFRIDINRIRKFENINGELALSRDLSWDDFYKLFRVRYGFVPKYFLKYLKYKEKYLNLVKKINNNILNYNYINEIDL
jgi:hypothetical protein